MLYLREVELYDKAGKIDLRQNIASVSSVYPGTSPAYCVDQYVSNENTYLCVTNSGDPYPTFTVRYFCPLGTTIGALSRVVLYNVAGSSGWASRWYMLSNFTVDFLDANGIPDMRAWDLGPYSSNVYSYSPPSEWQPGCRRNPIPPPPPPGRPSPGFPRSRIRKTDSQ
jgi:hypothetical protein